MIFYMATLTCLTQYNIFNRVIKFWSIFIRTYSTSLDILFCCGWIISSSWVQLIYLGLFAGSEAGMSLIIEYNFAIISTSISRQNIFMNIQVKVEQAIHWICGGLDQSEINEKQLNAIYICIYIHIYTYVYIYINMLNGWGLFAIDSHLHIYWSVEASPVVCKAVAISPN